MSTSHQAWIYCDYLVNECGGERDAENGRWRVIRDGAELDVSLIEDGFPRRVLIAALVTTRCAALDVDRLSELENAMPFGRLSIDDDGLWVTERIHMDAVNPSTFAHAIDFVRWAAGVVAEETDLAGRQPTLVGADDADRTPTAPQPATDVTTSGRASPTDDHVSAGYL